MKGKLLITCLLAIFLLGSCNENKLLEELPLDFYSPENSYVTQANFESALTDLYARVRNIHYGSNDYMNFAHFLATDIGKSARGTPDRFGDYDVFVVPTHAMIRFHWVEWFKVISNANTILSRMEGSELTAEQQLLMEAEARFFRALAYRYLVYLYGGVPIILEEVASPRTDFARASKEEVLLQIVDDLTFSSQNLSAINSVIDGRVSNLVAYHFLSETYVSLNRFDEAIAAASKIIDDPNTALMTERFGTKANLDPQDDYLQLGPGDPFWDLFQRGNQNRSTGNREGLWVIQMEVDVIGGGLQSGGGNFNALERFVAPVAFLTYLDPDGKEGSIGLPQSNFNTGGRGASFLMNTDYFLNDIWMSDWDNDIRNAPHNIVRDFVYTNPSSRWKDSSSVKYPSPTKIAQDWRWYPYPSKVTTPGDHPDNLFISKEDLTLNSTAASTYRDMYLLRLPETYLLRAEAFWRKGDLASAATDINVVRSRAKATPVTPEEVNLDYILDERARELIFEEQRRITLHRTQTLVERVRKYNDMNRDEIKDHHGLWPIPYAEIEANVDVVIDQNPGY